RREVPQGDHEPVQHEPLRHQAVPEAEAQRPAQVRRRFELPYQHDGRGDGNEAQGRKPERGIAQRQERRAERDQHGRSARRADHSSKSRPSSRERYTASSTRWRASWSRGGGALTSPLMTARKYVHSARYDWAKGVSRPLAPVGVASMIVPCTSLNTRSGLTLAEPLAPTRSAQFRYVSPI